MPNDDRARKRADPRREKQRDLAKQRVKHELLEGEDADLPSAPGKASRADRALQRKTPGTPLGKALARKLAIRAHDQSDPHVNEAARARRSVRRKRKRR